MLASNVLDLQNLIKSLDREIPELHWTQRGAVMRATLPNSDLRITVSQCSNFARVICHGLPDARPIEMLKLTSLLWGPARVTQTIREVNQLEASWPLSFDARKHGEMFAADMRRLLNSVPASESSPVTTFSDIRRHLKSVIASQHGFTIVPAKANKNSFDFIVGRKRSAR